MNKIEVLRKLMAERNIFAYIVPSADPFGSEFPEDHYKCREFMTGFTGSNGTLLVTQKSAGLWTDGRYFLQAEAELPPDITLFKMGDPDVPSIEDFVAEEIKKAGFKADGPAPIIAADGNVVMMTDVERVVLRCLLENVKIDFKYDEDLVGLIWENRPELSDEEPWPVPDDIAGETAESKTERALKTVRNAGADMILISDLDEIGWLYNLRGNLSKYAPVILGKGEKLYLDPEKTNYYTYMKLLAKGEYEILQGPSIVDSLKCIKNPSEIENMILTHIKDGVALTKLIYILKHWDWSEKITELDVVKYLDGLRASQDGYICESFETISGYGPNGAIIHYAPTKESSLPLKNEGFLLLDSGGTYFGGTTDVTRTISLGHLTDEMISNYTTVLKANLSLASAVFEKGTDGTKLDRFARDVIKAAGYDYKHGTGHGVGYMLNVHEGPQEIRPVSSSLYGPCEFKPGMITSDEPGIYIEGRYGIRIENLLLSVDAGNNKLAFENITLAPYDREAIDESSLTDGEVKILNEYFNKLREIIAPKLTEAEAEWLFTVTEPIKRDRKL